MDIRLKKQLIYGLGFLFILLLAAFPFWLMSRPAPTCEDGKLNQNEEEIDCGGPCVSCEIKKLKPIAASAQVIPLRGTTNVVVFFSNPNIFYGAKDFKYSLSFSGSGTTTSLDYRGFIYPAEQNRAVVQANLSLPAGLEVDTVQVSITDPDWRSVGEFSLPETQLREVAVGVLEKEKVATISAILVNGNPFSITRADVSIIFYDESEIVIGLTRTTLQDIEAFGERFFKVTAPLEASTVDLGRTEILVYPIK